jgi:choline transporter-like protein 2/4/5
MHFLPIATSLFRTLRFHSGSLAFGALVLTVVHTIRVIVEYINNKTKDIQEVGR